MIFGEIGCVVKIKAELWAVSYLMLILRGHTAGRGAGTSLSLAFSAWSAAVRGGGVLPARSFALACAKRTAQAHARRSGVMHALAERHVLVVVVVAVVNVVWRGGFERGKLKIRFKFRCVGW